MALVLVGTLWITLQHLPRKDDAFSWAPFVVTIVLFCLGFFGMAYSFYPYVVPDALTLYDAASAPESLFIILVGTVFVLPMIGGYTVLSYIVFRGKASELRYD